MCNLVISVISQTLLKQVMHKTKIHTHYNIYTNNVATQRLYELFQCNSMS